MVRRTDGEGWAFPGGGLKEGESPEQAAYREFWEETGYRLGSVGKLQMRRIKDGVDFSTFTASVDDEFVPTLNHEHDAWAWVDPMTTLDEAKLSSATAPAMQTPVYADDAVADDFDESKVNRVKGGEGGGQFTSKGGGGSGGGSEAPKSEKPASEAPKAASKPSSPGGGKDAPAQVKAAPEETDPDIKAMAAKLAPRTSQSPEAMAARLAPLTKGLSSEQKTKVKNATKKFLGAGAAAGALSLVSKEAVAHTLNAAQMKAVETIGEKVTDVVNEGLSYALEAGLTALGFGISHGVFGHDVMTSTAIASVGAFVARYAVSALVEKIGIGEEGLGRKLLMKACRAILGTRKKEPVAGSGDAADPPDENGQYGDEDVVETIKLLLKLLEGQDDEEEEDDEEKADGFADACDESKVSRGQPKNAGQFGPGGNSANPKAGAENQKSETEGSRQKTEGGAPVEFGPTDPAAFIAARDKSSRMAFMSPLKPDDLKDHKLFMSADGKVGVAVDKDGDIQNVFNNKGPRGAGAYAVAEAIKQGGRMLDAYSGYLPEFYRQFGFEETGRMAFNPEFAHDPELSKNKPDVVFMAWKGYGKDDEESVIARATGNHKDWLPNVKSDRTEDDYDAAKARSKNAAGNVQRGGDGGDRDDGEKLGSKADAGRNQHVLGAGARAWSDSRARGRDGFTDAYQDARADEDELSDAVLDAIADAIVRLDARIGRMDARFADEFKEHEHPRGHPKNKGMFSKGSGVVEPTETHEPVEPFEEPTKDPSPGGKALKEANEPASPEEHEANLKQAKATGEQQKIEQEKALDKQHEQAIELVAAKADPKAAAKKVAGKKPSKLGDAPEEINKEALSPERLTEMSALPLFEGAGVPIKGSVTRKGGEVVSEGTYQPGDRNNVDVANDLVQRGQAWLKELGYPNGRVDSTNTTPEVDEALATTFAEEAKRALDAARAENPERSAENWYRSALDEAVNVAAITHPEIKTDPQAKSAFSAAMAITSQGETVFSNARLADIAYESFKKNGGRFRLKKGDLKANKQKMMLNNFKKYDALMDTMKDEPGRAFLETEMPVKDFMQATGSKTPPTGFGVDGKVYGSAMFGPKIGNGFFQNLIGNYEPLTQDLWLTRTFGRMTGTLRDVVKTDEGVTDLYSKFSDLLGKGDEENKIEPRKVASSRDQIDKQALEVFKEAEADYKANGKAYKAKTKTRPLLYSAAIRMENMINGVNDQPGGSGDRAWKGEIINKAKAKLKAEGIDLSTADLQATMWYPEKTLWKRMGSKGPIGGNADYSDAFQLLAMNKGHDSADIERITGRKVKANLADLDKSAVSEDDEPDDGLGAAAE